MTNEQIRIAVAEAMGYREIIPHDAELYALSEGHDYPYPTGFDGKDTEKTRLPHYPDDLNACHAMEKTLSVKQAVCYRVGLQSNSGGPKSNYRSVEAAMCHATALERCEAFLRVKGLWK